MMNVGLSPFSNISEDIFFSISYHLKNNDCCRLRQVSRFWNNTCIKMEIFFLFKVNTSVEKNLHFVETKKRKFNRKETPAKRLKFGP